MRDLATVLADWRSVAHAAGRTSDDRMKATILEICGDVARAAEDWLTFISEPDAMLRSGRAERWLRSRFAEWEAEGHAEKRGKVRYYRQAIIPQRGNASAAYEAGRRAARGEQAA